MTYSSDFVKTVALIAAKACSAKWWPVLTPEQAVDFAWFSVNCVGDAAEDDSDLRAHFALWVESKQQG